MPAQGYKSVEIVQAYLLNTLWGCGPVERYEQDRTWMLLGMAIRLVYVPCLFRLPGMHLEGRVPRHDATKPLTNVLCLTADDHLFLAEWPRISICTDEPLSQAQILRRVVRAIERCTIGSEHGYSAFA